MKKTLFAIATAALTTATAISHAAEINNGFFINGNIGQSNLDNSIYNNNDTGYGVNIGYRWVVNPSVALGIEGGYTDLGKFDYKYFFAGYNNRTEISGWNLGVNGHFNLNPNWYISGRGGWFRSEVGNHKFFHGDNTSNNYYLGAGFGYDFNNNFSIGLNYDYFKTGHNNNLDPSLVSVSAEYRF